LANEKSTKGNQIQYSNQKMKEINVRAKSLQDVHEKIKSTLKMDTFRIEYPREKGSICLESLDDIPYRHPIRVVQEREKGPQLKPDIHKPWIVDSVEFTKVDKFKFLVANLNENDKSFKEIVNFFKNTAINEEITRITLIKNDILETNFENRLILIRDRRDAEGDDLFNTKWEVDSERQSVMDRFNAVCCPKVADHGKAKLIQTWIGCQISVIKALCNTGPADLRIRDKGYFGAGIYSTRCFIFHWRY